MNRIISWGEVRLALRLIAKQPILSITVIVALATGICIATIGFTFREEMVNSTLPYAAGDRFARVLVVDRDGDRLDLNLDQYRAIRDHATSFEHVGALVSRPFTVTHADGEVEAIRGARITARSMRWIEAVPLLGRTLIPSDSEPGAERVVVLSEKLWQRRYSGDRAVVGRELTIGNQLHTIVGVMPEAFRFPTSEELWVPADELTMIGVAGTPGQRVFAVLKPGVSFETADAEVARLAPPAATTGDAASLTHGMVRPFTSDNENADLIVSALVFMLVMVLLVIASNVATLIFARTWSRAPELAVRTALGAPRSRVVGQLFMEMLTLGSIAAVVGFAGAFGILGSIKEYLFNEIGFWHTFAPTPAIVLFVIFLTLLVGAVSGLLPALRVTRHDLRGTLYSGRGLAAGGFGRVGAVLLVIEIALSVGLLNGAVTMARAFDAYVQDVPAMPNNTVVTAQLGRIRGELRGRVVEAARTMPGVVAAGAANALPRLYPQPRPTAVEAIEGEPVQAAMPAPSHAVGEGFLDAIGARTLSGRMFAHADFAAGAAPVAIVNEPFVRKFLGGRNPIGRRIRIAAPREDGAEEPWREIVGVVPDLGLSVANATMAGGFYYPSPSDELFFIAVRAPGDPIKLTPQLRSAVVNIDPDAQLDEIQLLENAGREERLFLTTAATVLTAIGGVALALSIVAIYALLSFMVTRRTREIGIRMALGATSRRVLQSVTGAAMTFLAIGGVLGTLLSFALLQLRDSLLISLPATDAWTPGLIIAILAIAGLAACWVPARRALGIRPAEALNAD